MNRKCLRRWLALAIASGFVLQPQAQQRPKDEPPKTPAHQEFEARRGLPGFEWIEPLYPDCPEERFRMRNDECGGVKKHPGDPEAVLGDYWRRSVWAYSAQFAEHFKPADKSAVRADLPRHVQAIELRVAWDQEHYRYDCELHMFMDKVLLDHVMLPEGIVGRRFTDAGMIPPGSLYQLPLTAATRFKFPNGYDEYFFYDGFNQPKERGRIGGGRGVLQQYHKEAYGDLGYLALKIGCGSENDKFKRFRLWLPASRTQVAPTEVARYEMGGHMREYLIVDLPVEPFHRAAPYWRRAFGLNVCRSDGQHAARWSTGGRERQFRACEALRREPIDSSRTLIELQKEQWELDQRQKVR